MDAAIHIERLSQAGKGSVVTALLSPSKTGDDGDLIKV